MPEQTVPLRAWLVTVGEPLPTDPGTPRLLRTGMVASQMHRRGLEVTWWTSSFDHQRKALRVGAPESGRSPEGYRLELLAGDPYASNVSFARIRNHRQTAAQFASRAASSPRPDVILCSYPTIELSQAAIAYGRANGVPVVLDLRDLWPDIFLNLAPAVLRPLARMALAGMFRASRQACRQASAIVGITDAFVDWGVHRADRVRSPVDVAFPLAYETNSPPQADMQRAREYWDATGVRADGFNLCFFGTLGRQFDIPAVIEAARRMADRPVRFVLCGSGDSLQDFRSLAKGLPNVMFPGWVDASAIRVLMERSAAGLAPYHSEKSFTMSIPNKAIEYMAGGLPLLSSLRGELAALLEETGAGLTWREGEPGSLEACIERLRLDPAQRSRMAERSLATYGERFRAEKVYGRLIDHLCRIAATEGITFRN